MSAPEDRETVSGTNLRSENKYDTRDGEPSLENLLQLSKSFKTDLEENLNKFKEEKLLTINEITGINYCSRSLPNEKSDEINNNLEKRTGNKHMEDSNVSFWEGSCETLAALQQELKNIQNDLNVQRNRNEFKQEKEVICNCMSSVQNKIDELHETYLNQTYDEKTNYFKKISEIENKCQRWTNKYNELYDKYLRLEAKCVNIEQENCSYQIEIARIRTIENENSRLNEAINKSNLVRTQLESALESCHGSVNKYQADVNDARNKVKEAVEVVEKTCAEKERLAADLNISNEEIVRLENELKNLIQEAGAKVNSEVNEVKTMYKDKLRDANVQIEVLIEENRAASIKTQQTLKDYEILNKKYESINQKYANQSDEHSTKLALHIQQIKEHEDAFDKQTSDIQILKEINRKLQESYARKKTKYTMEIHFLMDSIKSLETHLSEALNQIADDNVRIVKASDRIKTLEMEISKMKQPEVDIEQKNIQIEELLKQVDAHQQVVDMWRTEMRNMIEKFKYKIDQLKEKYNKLHKKNIKLKRIVNCSKINRSIRKKMSKLRKTKIPVISSLSTST